MCVCVSTLFEIETEICCGDTGISPVMLSLTLLLETTACIPSRTRHIEEKHDLRDKVPIHTDEEIEYLSNVLDTFSHEGTQDI